MILGKSGGAVVEEILKEDDQRVALSSHCTQSAAAQICNNSNFFGQA